MIPPWEEPRICRGCDTEPCNGDYLACMQAARDAAADREYDLRRDA